MLATLSLMGMRNIHTMNALKVVLAGCVNSVALLTFIFAGIVEWPQALVMMAGAIIGGWAAPRWRARSTSAISASMSLSWGWRCPSCSSSARTSPQTVLPARCTPR